MRPSATNSSTWWFHRFQGSRLRLLLHWLTLTARRTKPKQFPHLRRKFAICHSVNRPHVCDSSSELLALQALDEFPFSFPRAKNQNRFRITQAINDIVVELVKVVPRLAIARFFRLEVVDGMRVSHSRSICIACGGISRHDFAVFPPTCR